MSIEERFYPSPASVGAASVGAELSACDKMIQDHNQCEHWLELEKERSEQLHKSLLAKEETIRVLRSLIIEAMSRESRW